jgi:flagellar basal-body rod modification protein FlgD
MDPVTGPGSTTAATSLSQAMGGNKSLDRDAFLKLLVAQLKNQDPLKPQDNSAFVAELAQFSSLEQSMGINDRLDLLAAQNAGLANAQAVGLVGSVATVRGSMVTVDGKGLGVPVGFSLSGETNSTIVTVRNQSGQVVRTLDVGARDAGFVSLMWDGRNEAGIIQPAGTYVIGVAAENAVGAPVAVSQETSGKVKQVSFDKGYPVLTLDNGMSVPVSDLLKVAVSPTTPTP